MKSLKVHCFQHADFEDAGCIKDWCHKNEYRLTYTKFFKNEPIPEPAEYDCLIIMGGPMNVFEENNYPWLTMEKSAIKKAIEQDKIIIGICLGAQLIANVLGAKVNSNTEKEIGWFDISLTESAKQSLFTDLSSPLKVFHWHGDTFEIPKSAKHLATSEAYQNQAFLYKEKVLALQFHLEVTEKNIKAMLENGRQELIQQKYVQTEKAILAQRNFIKENNNIMFRILDNLSA